MNNEEAKFILQGYRVNGADAGDATFCAALDQAKNDPALAQWFARQQSFDAAISAKLAQVSPPAELRAAILAGGRVTVPGRSPRRWWTQPAWLGAAAAVAVLLVVGVALRPKPALAFDEFAYQDSAFSAIHGHGDHGAPTNALQWALAQPTTKLGQSLPVDFAKLRDTGCRHLKFRGHEVLEICFNRNGEWFHCYIARTADFPHALPGNGLQFLEKSGASLATWMDAEHVFVIVSKAGRESLHGLL